MEYIDREAAIEAISKLEFVAMDVIAADSINGAFQIVTRYMDKQLRKLPAADVRPVVRCKDCRFREECVERFKAEEAKGEYDWLKEKKEKKHELGMDTHILCD